MITQELVAFIKQQLQEGKSKEQIANILTPHGWELADINAVFAQLLPTAAPVTPPAAVEPLSPMATMLQSSAQSPVANSAVTNGAMMGASVGAIQAQMQPSAQSGFVYALKNPSMLFAGVAAVVSAIASTLLVYYINMSQMTSSILPQSQFPTTVNQNALIGGILATMVVGILFSSLITRLITKILSITPRTFGQALTFSSVSLLVTAIFSSSLLIGVHAAVPAVVGIIFWVVFFWYYYSTGIGKAIGAFFLNLLAGIVIAGLLFAAALGLGIGMIATIMNGFRGVVPVQSADQVVQIPNDMQSLPLVTQTGLETMQSSSSTILSPEDTLNAIIAGTNGVATGDLALSASSTSATPAAITNPDYTHVKDALPVGFPLPKDEQVISAVVLSANTYEGVRYILEYTSTNSLAYLRNNMKTALEKAGYSYSINEKDANYRVITATQVVRGSVRSFRIELKQVGTTDATVKLVFNQ